MNKLLLKQISIFSILVGFILAFLTLIPFIGQFAFLALMCLTSVFIITLMVKLDLLEILSTQESVILGALIGFVSFMAFAVIYLPIVLLIGKIFNTTSLYGISVFLNAGSFGIIFMLTVFVAVLSATVNAFSSFITFYVLEFLKTLEKNDKNDKFNLR